MVMTIANKPFREQFKFLNTRKSTDSIANMLRKRLEITR